MTDQQHEGWANYETWLVALWFDNDERRYDKVTRLIGSGATKLAIRVQAALWLDEEIARLDWVPCALLVKDLTNHGASRVNWREIAEHWMAKA